MSNALDTGTIYSESHLICDDGNGRERFATQRNLGWHETAGGYVSVFVVDGIAHYALFVSPKKADDICPDPARRLAFDMEFLEVKLGLLLVDAEAVELA